MTSLTASTAGAERSCIILHPHHLSEQLQQGWNENILLEIHERPLGATLGNSLPDLALTSLPLTEQERHFLAQKPFPDCGKPKISTKIQSADKPPHPAI